MENTHVPEPDASATQRETTAGDVLGDAVSDFPTTLEVLDTCADAAKVVVEHLGDIVGGICSGL